MRVYPTPTLPGMFHISQAASHFHVTVVFFTLASTLLLIVLTYTSEMSGSYHKNSILYGD